MTDIGELGAFITAIFMVTILGIMLGIKSGGVVFWVLLFVVIVVDAALIYAYQETSW